MKRSFLFNSVLNYLTSSFFSTICSFLLLLYFSRNLEISEFSKYTLVIFLIQAISKFIILGLDSSLVRFYRDDNEKNKYLINSFLILFIVSIITLILIKILNRNILQKIVTIDTNLLNLIFITCIFEVFYQIYLAHQVASLNSKKYKKIILLRNGSQFILIIISFPFYNSIATILICNIFSVLILFFTFNLIYSYKQIINTNFYSKRVLRKLLVYGGPLVFYSLFSLTTDYSSRIFLSVNKQFTGLANFHFFLQIILYGQGFIALLSKTWTPYAFDLILKSSLDLRFYIRRIIVLFYIFILIILIILLFFYKIGFLNLFIKHEYLTNFNVLILLIPSLILILMYMLISPFYYLNKNTIKLTLVNIICNILNLLISFFLTHKFGIYGATYAFILFNLIFLIIFPIFFYKSNTFEIIKISFIELLFFIFIIIFLITFNFNFYYIILFLCVNMIILIWREMQHLIFYKSIISKI